MADAFTQGDRMLGTAGTDTNGKKGFYPQVSLLGGTPSGQTALNASSGNVANASAVATLTGAAGATTYLTGFEITGAGATAPGVVVATVTGLLGGTMSYIVTAMTGATSANTPLVVVFDPAQPASAVNTAIVVTLPALGAGNTNAAVSAHGYRI